jgi:hypothetical protein
MDDNNTRIADRLERLERAVFGPEAEHREWEKRYAGSAPKPPPPFDSSVMARLRAVEREIRTIEVQADQRLFGMVANQVRQQFRELTLWHRFNAMIAKAQMPDTLARLSYILGPPREGISLEARVRRAWRFLFGSGSESLNAWLGINGAYLYEDCLDVVEEAGLGSLGR